MILHDHAMRAVIPKKFLAKYIDEASLQSLFPSYTYTPTAVPKHLLYCYNAA